MKCKFWLLIDKEVCDLNIFKAIWACVTEKIYYVFIKKIPENFGALVHLWITRPR